MKIEGFFYIKFVNFDLNISFSINHNNIIAIIGRSGSGKTTFLKCLSGLVKSQHGYLKINNFVVQNSKENKFLPTNKRVIGHVLQNGILFNNFSVFENMCLGFDRSVNTPFDLDNVINYLKIKHLLNKSVKFLSGGEKQRILIAQVLLTQPKIILLDESFSSQDLLMKKNLFYFFKKINKFYSVPIIYVSHNISDVENFADNIFFIEKGKISLENINI